MRNAPEVIRQIGVNDFWSTTEQQLLHLDHRLLGIAARAVGVLLWWKIGFEDRLQHQHRCCHADPIPQSANTQRSKLAIGLRYPHSFDWIRLVLLFSECMSQFAKPSLRPIRFNIREVL